ncbi:MAG: DUF4360 domain-containing protein [Minicystis sp.]
MKNIVISTSLVALALSGLPGEAGGAAPPAVTIVDVAYEGAGCPAGSADVALSTDKQLLYLGFDQYSVKTVPGGASVARRDCQIRVRMHFEPVWSFAISTVDYRGFAGLGPGVVGEQVSSYSFAGQPPTPDTKMRTTIVGPFFDNYARRDNVRKLAHSPCGSPDPVLVIDTAVSVNGVDGEVTVDSLVKKVKHAYHLAWRKCR